MPPDQALRFRPRLTIRHLVVLVVFAAVASAVVMPQVRSSSGVWNIGVAALIEVPYALLIPALFLIRSGPAKTWLVGLLCFVPPGTASVASVVGLYFLARAKAGRPWQPIEVIGLGVLSVLASGLIAFAAYIARQWVVPRSCPFCRRLALLSDASVPRVAGLGWRSEPRTCLACGGRFRRAGRGPWVEAVAPPPLAEPWALGRTSWVGGRGI